MTILSPIHDKGTSEYKILRREPMSELHCYTGGRMPLLGTPLAVVGMKNDERKKSLLFDAHVFFDGKAKAYHTFQLQSDYDHADSDQVGNYISVVNQMVQDGIEKIIQDEMVEKGIPFHLYQKVALCKPEDSTLLLYSICSRGFDKEVEEISRSSAIEKLRSEFTKITKLAKIKIRISGAS